ncbi:MAG: metal-dependent transcriptional regulator [Coriobacteriales bacterium]|nr:metal-dependent transcriptional regulator [Coriobacteriales bacterium]
MAMHESGEMYLETIYVLSQESPKVRSVDVGERMGFSKPSVSRALGILKKNNMAVTNEHGHIQLTEAGEKIAKRIYERHVVLTQLLINLGVSEATATEDACRIEHYISDETFAAIKAHMKEHGTEVPTPFV